MITLRSKFRGAILGTAIGDALGAPMETMWAKDIAERFPHFSADCIDYVESTTDEDRGFGKWTDDTQLMIPTAESIIKDDGKIVIETIAKAYVDVFKTQKLRGWGRSTIQSLKRLSEGVPWHKASEESLGTGNGPPMKAAPLGLVLSATMTHANAHDLLILLSSIFDVCKITHKEKGIRAGVLQSVLVASAIHNLTVADTIMWLDFSESNMFGDCVFLEKVKSLISLPINEICETGGVTSKAEESWCSTAAVFLTHCQREHLAMPALVGLIKQGGDTDTTGAMLGALIGAKYGDLLFPNRLRERLESYSDIVYLGDKLFDRLHHNDNKYR